MTTHMSVSWVDDAVCFVENIDTDVFFPANEEKGGGPAKQICARCPVADKCLREAVLMSETIGIRGGLTGRERRRLQVEAGTFNYGRWKDKTLAEVNG